MWDGFGTCRDTYYPFRCCLQIPCCLRISRNARTALPSRCRLWSFLPTSDLQNFREGYAFKSVIYLGLTPFNGHYVINDRCGISGLTSRFIGLGRLSSATKVSSEKRLKFLHALILKPMSDLPTQSLLATPSTTPSPYFSLYNPRSSTALFPTPLAFPHFESPSRYKRARPLDLGFSHLDGLSQTPPGTSTGCVPSDPSSPYESKRQRISDPTVPSTTTPASSPFAVIHNLLSNRNIGPVPPRPPPRPTDEQQEIHTNSVFITNIPYEVDSESFTDVMKSFGTVISHNFPRTPDGMSTGRA